jgi:hypothetical protein
MSSKLLSVFFVIAGLAVWAFALDTTAAGTKVQGVPGVLADPAQFQRRSEPAASIAGNWRLTGNAGTNSTNFLGTTDGQPLNFRVNDQRALRLEPNSQSPNVIGGSGVNVAEAGTVGSTIGGGGMANLPNVVSGVLATIGGGGDNRVENTAATIAGGIDNRATGGQATVGGGIANAASADRATVGGGRQNRATGEGATIPGGAFNLALGSFSFAAGYRAHAGDAGSFVWGDSTNEDVSSTGPDQFVVRARGGLHLRDGQLFCDGCVTVDDLAPGTTQGLRPYCALVRAHPMSYEGAPCLHHSETVDGFTGNTSIAIGTDGNPGHQLPRFERIEGYSLQGPALPDERSERRRHRRRAQFDRDCARRQPGHRVSAAGRLAFARAVRRPELRDARAPNARLRPKPLSLGRDRS